ncbi:MAG: bifunctional diaminohydroxyphosphoribosylaminopyrimidine deaminase/5-amino-6-(5-phosphoribosylamino)uracil reductase RibD [Propylenella sp.]
MTEALDRRFVAAAIGLGAGALGTAWPNPAVGAILVKDGRVVGRGRTGRAGRPHGEALALAMAGEEARGATLYVSLEPCAHFGKTPPCADAIVAAGVSRVVTTISDPDPRVAGRGFDRLRAAGVEVVSGLFGDEAKRAHAGHFNQVVCGRPYVLLKLAVSADDAIGREGESQVAVTSPVARRHVQALRSRFDAILIGRGTVEADDPQLTCRLPGLSDRSPIRIVLDSDGALAPDRKVLTGTARTWVFVGEVLVPPPSPATGEEPSVAATCARSSVDGEASQVRTLAAPRGATGLDLPAVLRTLAEEGITRVLVEGGAHVARGFLEADLVDAAMLFRSPERLGGNIVPALAGLPLSEIEVSPKYRRIARRRFGPDVMSLYERA